MLVSAVTSVASSSPAPSATPFGRRTVAYPAESGSELGGGWDFILNQKTQSTCIDFQGKNDNLYQNAEISIQQVIDDETFDIALNAEMSGSVGGTIEVVKASAEAKTTMNASHHIATSDTSFVAHGSVTSGVTFVGPDPKVGLALKAELVQLAGANPAEFRRRCGDGYVSSIGYGADLYLLLHAHDLSREDHLKLEFDSKATAGIGDVFSAGGSGNFGTTISDLVSKKALDIEFVQKGGIITTVPTTLATATAKVAGLATEEKAGPRPIFMTLVSYSELPNWPSIQVNDISDQRQRAVRYVQRLTSALYEIQNMREDRNRDRTSAGSVSDAYLFDYRHQLRLDNLNQQITDIKQRLAVVDEILDELGKSECNPSAVSTVFFAMKGKTLKAQRAVFDRTRAMFGQSQRACIDKLNALKTRTNDFDDFEFWIKMPIPLNAIPSSDLTIIQDSTADAASRKDLFAQNLYRQWVERIDQDRCRLFFECLDAAQKAIEYSKIVTSIPASPPVISGIVMTVVKACNGEDVATPLNPSACAGDRIHYTCDERTNDVNATSQCESQRKSFGHTFSVGNSRGGNNCGYYDIDFTCYNFKERFP